MNLWNSRTNNFDILIHEVKESLEVNGFPNASVFENTLGPFKKFISQLEDLPNEYLIISDHTFEKRPNSDDYCLSGNMNFSGGDSWQLPGNSNVIFTDLFVEITFSPTSDKSETTISLKITDGTCELSQEEFANISWTVSGLLTDTAQLAITLTPSEASKKDLDFHLQVYGNFIWINREPDYLPPGVGFAFGDKYPITGLNFIFTPEGSTETFSSIVCSHPERWTPVPNLKLFSFTEVGLEFIFIYSPDTSTNQYSYSSTLFGDFEIKVNKKKTTFKVFIDFVSQAQWSLRIQPNNGNILPGLEDIVDYLSNITSISSSDIKQAFSNSGIDSLIVRNIEFGFDIKQGEINFAQVEGEAAIEKGKVWLSVFLLPEFQISVQFPSMNSSTASTNGINVNNLLEKVYQPISNFPDVDIDYLQLLANPSDSLYQFNLEVGGDWTVFNENGQSLEVTNLGLNAIKSGKNLSGQISGTINFANEIFLASAEKDGAEDGWSLNSQVVSKKGIPLFNLMENFFELFDLKLPAHSPIPKIFSLSDLGIIYNTNSSKFNFYGSILEESKFPILDFITLDLYLTFKGNSSIHPNTKKRIFEGELISEIEIDDAEFQFSYQLGTDTSIVRLAWEGEKNTSLNLNQILSYFGDVVHFNLPSYINPSLSSAAIDIDLINKDLTLVANTNTSETSESFLQIKKIVDDKPYRGVFGVSAGSDSSFSSLPEPLSKILTPLNSFTLNYACFIVATESVTNFVPPSIEGQKTNPFAPISNRAFPLVEGINLAMKITFSSSSSSQRKLIRDVLPRTMTFVMSVDRSDGAYLLESFLGGEIDLRVPSNSSGGPRLNLLNPSVKILIEEDNETTPVVVQVAGTIIVPIGSSVLYATVNITFNEEEAAGGFMLRETIEKKDNQKPVALISPMGVKGVSIDNIGGEVAFQLEPFMGIQMGLEADFQLGGESYGSNKVEFYFYLDGDVPVPIYWYIYMEELEMSVFLNACLDTSASYPSFMSDISISNLMIYWCDSSAGILPDGTATQIGFGFNGLINIYGIKAYAFLIIDQEEGISGQAQLSPINLSGLSITGGSKEIKLNQMKKNGSWHNLTRWPIRIKKTPNFEEREYMKGGGATLLFNTSGPNYLSTSFDINLFGITHRSVNAEISNNGLSFKLNYAIANIIDMELACTIINDKSFSAKSNFVFGLDRRFGPIDLDGIDLGYVHVVSDFHAEISLVISDSGFKLKVQGSFSFEGVTIHLHPKIEINEPISSIASLISTIETSIQNNASHLFASIIDRAKAILAAAEKEADSILSEGEKSVTNLASNAKKAATSIIKDAKIIASASGKEIQKIIGQINQDIKTIEKDAADEVNEINSKAERLVSRFNDEVSNIKSDTEKKILSIEKNAKEEIGKIKHDIEHIKKKADQDAKQIGETSEDEITQILSVAKSVANVIEENAKKELKRMRKEAEDLIDEAKKQGEAFVDETKEIASDAGNVAEDGWNEFKGLFG